MCAVGRQPHRAAGSCDEARRDAGAVEVRTPDRVLELVVPIDVRAVDGQGCRRQRARPHEPENDAGTVEIGAADPAVEVEPIDVGPGDRHLGRLHVLRAEFFVSRDEVHVGAGAVEVRPPDRRVEPRPVDVRSVDSEAIRIDVLDEALVSAGPVEVRTAHIAARGRPVDVSSIDGDPERGVACGDEPAVLATAVEVRPADGRAVGA